MTVNEEDKEIQELGKYYFDGFRWWKMYPDGKVRVTEEISDLLNFHKAELTSLVDKPQVSLNETNNTLEGKSITGGHKGSEVTQTPNSEMTEHKSIEEIAKLFHETYERLAPQYGYETRADTKEFDKDSPNGKLMIAVIAELIPHFNSRNLLCGNAGDNVYLTFKGGCREPLTLENSYRCTGCGGRFHKDCILKHFELEKDHDWGRKQEREALKITGETSDGYHTFNELYEFRKLYNACLFNEWSARGLYKVHKSKKHSDGEDCFGGDWFIVTATLPTGQISNHYELKDWDLFQCEEREKADVWDGHTPQDVAKRLETLAKLPIQNSRNLLERFVCYVENKWDKNMVLSLRLDMELDEFIESEGLK